MALSGDKSTSSPTDESPRVLKFDRVLEMGENSTAADQVRSRGRSLHVNGVEGDMVWAKVESLPRSPGYICNKDLGETVGMSPFQAGISDKLSETVGMSPFQAGISDKLSDLLGSTAEFPFDLSPGPQPQASLVIPYLQIFRNAATSLSKPDIYVHKKSTATEKQKSKRVVKMHKEKVNPKEVAGLELTTESEHMKRVSELAAKFGSSFSQGIHSMSGTAQFKSLHARPKHSSGTDIPNIETVGISPFQVGISDKLSDLLGSTAEFPFDLSPGPQPQASLVIPYLQIFQNAATSLSKPDIYVHKKSTATEKQKSQRVVKKHKEKVNLKEVAGVELTTESENMKWVSELAALFGSRFSQGTHSMSGTAQFKSLHARSKHSSGTDIPNIGPGVSKLLKAKGQCSSRKPSSAPVDRTVLKRDVVSRPTDIIPLAPPREPQEPIVSLIDDKVSKSSLDQVLDSMQKNEAMIVGQISNNVGAKAATFKPTTQPSVWPDEVEVQSSSRKPNSISMDKRTVLQREMVNRPVDPRSPPPPLRRPQEHMIALIDGVVNQSKVQKSSLDQVREMVSRQVDSRLPPPPRIHQEPNGALIDPLVNHDKVSKSSHDQVWKMITSPLDPRPPPPSLRKPQEPHISLKAINRSGSKIETGNESICAADAVSAEACNLLLGSKRSAISIREEMAAKKSKSSVSEMMVVATETRNRKDTGAALVQLKEAEIDNKEELQLVQRSYTFLLIKFRPKGDILPSIQELNTKLCVFGEVETKGTRRCWNSYTAWVLFVHRVDAMTALNYVKINCYLFRGCKVDNCTLRDAPEFLSMRPVNGNDASNSTQLIRHASLLVPLEFIPKKHMNQASHLPSSELPKSVLKSASFLPSQIPHIVSHARPQQSTKSSQPSHVAMANRASTIPSTLVPSPEGWLSMLPPPPSTCLMVAITSITPDSRGVMASESSKEDISVKMLNLLRQNFVILQNLKSALGYMPLREL